MTDGVSDGVSQKTELSDAPPTLDGEHCNHNEDGDVYVGRDVRTELIDIYEDEPDSPIWLGWLDHNRVVIFHETYVVSGGG